MTDDSTGATIADYLRGLRRHRLLVTLTALICCGAALIVSLSQEPVYEARAALVLRDLSQDLTVLGSVSAVTQTPLQLASAHVPVVTRTGVVREVKERIRTDMTVDELRDSVDVSVDPNSNLVVIDARADDAETAAQIANGFARVDVRRTVEDTRRRFAEQAEELAVRERRLERRNRQEDATARLLLADQLSRVRSLSLVADPIRVSESARAPDTQSSPRPVRNSIAALIFGLFLGIALALARDTLDRRLREPSEVRSVLPLPIVGHIDRRALGSGLRQVGKKRPLTSLDLEALRILRQNLRNLAVDEDLRTVIVTSGMAQEGKSTVALGLATAHAAAGRRTLLVECDLRRPVLGARLGLAAGPGLSDYLLGEAEPGDILQRVDVAPDSERTSDENTLVCITAGRLPPDPTVLLDSNRFRTFLADVASVYDAVVLDSTPLLPVADALELIPHVDAVLVCARLDQTTRDQARATREALERLPEKPTGLILTGVRQSAQGYYGYDGYYATDAGAREPSVRS